MTVLKKWWRILLIWLELLDCNETPTCDLRQELADALKDWQLAQDFFAEATDPDLVDYSIYWVKCAEIRYTYLLRQAKTEGIWGQIDLLSVDSNS